MEVVFSAPDMATLITAATNAGFYVPPSENTSGYIVSQKALLDGESWFYNFVGPVYQPTGNTIKDAFGNDAPEMASVPGLWGRLRFNGDPAPLWPIIDICKAAGMTIYQRVTPEEGVSFWSSDGSTPGPDWLDGVGVIA